MKQRRSPPIRLEINFNPLVRPHDGHVFQNTVDLQPVALQMQRNEFVAGVVNLQTIARTRGDAKLRPIDGPAIESASGRRMSSQHDRQRLVRVPHVGSSQESRSAIRLPHNPTGRLIDYNTGGHPFPRAQLERAQSHGRGQGIAIQRRHLKHMTRKLEVVRFGCAGVQHLQQHALPRARPQGARQAAVERDPVVPNFTPARGAPHEGPTPLEYHHRLSIIVAGRAHRLNQ